jgi:hypothetical protein
LAVVVDQLDTMKQAEQADTQKDSILLLLVQRMQLQLAEGVAELAIMQVQAVAAQPALVR